MEELIAALSPEHALIAGAIMGALGCILLVLKIVKEFQGIQGSARSTAIIFVFVVLGLFSFLYAQASYKQKSDSLEQEKKQLSEDIEGLENTINENDTYIAQLESDKTALEQDFLELNANLQDQAIAKSRPVIKQLDDAEMEKISEISNEIDRLISERDSLLHYSISTKD